MAGYIYITGDQADPGAGRSLNDPLFSKIPTLGACMPHIRRAVSLGDYIFVVSARIPRVQQYVVGCFRVGEKISALQAYSRFPENRLQKDENGHLHGNVIVLEDGSQHPLDRHTKESLARRVQNYIVGSDPMSLVTPNEVELGRAESISAVSRTLGRAPANRMIDVIGRCSKLSDDQALQLTSWLRSVKSRA